MTLSNRIEEKVLERFNQDRRQALLYIRDKCHSLAKKIYDYERSTILRQYAKKWKEILKAYRSAEFTISYYLELDERFDESFYEIETINSARANK